MSALLSLAERELNEEAKLQHRFEESAGKAHQWLSAYEARIKRDQTKICIELLRAVRVKNL